MHEFVQLLIAWCALLCVALRVLIISSNNKTFASTCSMVVACLEMVCSRLKAFFFFVVEVALDLAVGFDSILPLTLSGLVMPWALCGLIMVDCLSVSRIRLVVRFLSFPSYLLLMPFFFLFFLTVCSSSSAAGFASTALTSTAFETRTVTLTGRPLTTTATKVGMPLPAWAS